MSESFDTIREAIKAKKLVVAMYHGHRRVLCPHTLGYKDGKEQALFYQCGGTSSSGLAPMGSPGNWRCIPLERLVIISVEDGEWVTCSQHTSAQTCVDHVTEEVAY